MLFISAIFYGSWVTTLNYCIAYNNHQVEQNFAPPVSGNNLVEETIHDKICESHKSEHQQELIFFIAFQNYAHPDWGLDYSQILLQPPKA